MKIMDWEFRVITTTRTVHDQSFLLMAHVEPLRLKNYKTDP